MFGTDLTRQQRAWRSFVLERLRDTDHLLAHTIAQGYLGDASWVDRIQTLLDEHERSEEHPREQVHPGRPELEDVIDAVAARLDTTSRAIEVRRGSLERRLVAWLAFEEGLIPQRLIARRLGVMSAGGISMLVSRCRAEIARDPEVRALVDGCRSRMRRQPPPSLFPPEVPPITARRYHRAAGRSRR